MGGQIGLRLGMAFALLFLVIFTLGVMDTLSTIIVMSNTDSSGYESNALYSFVYLNNGVYSFIALKLIVTTCFALAAFLIQYICKELEIVYICISIGLVLVGLFVTASNLAIALGGYDFTIFSMDPPQLSSLCLLGFLFTGFFLTVLQMMGSGENRPRRALYRDNFGMWLPYDD